MKGITHVFCTCQPGAEMPLKREVAARAPHLRFAFSRPGFVTFKIDEPTALDRLQVPRLIFARTRGASLGRLAQLGGMNEAASAVWQQEGVADLVAEEGPVKLHVWQRDAAVPGHHGFEPGATPLAREAHAAIAGAAPEGAIATGEGEEAKPGVALDVALVEPNEWWVGCHRIESRVDRWPGGTPPLELPEHAVSRAYLKMREALAWGRLTGRGGPAKKGDEWIELGCAPGGATQALLDAGMYVIGVDPAEVDEALDGHPRFCHHRKRAADVRRKEFVDARWLAADINAAPAYTLDAVEDVVKSESTSIRGLVLTLKLPEWDLATPEALLEHFHRVRGWGYQDVRARQLAFNRKEIGMVALRSRGQRRVRR